MDTTCFPSFGLPILLNSSRRRLPESSPHHTPCSSAFVDHTLNAEKTTLSLDLRESPDKIKMMELCKTSDVLLDPFRPKCLDRLGFSPAILHRLNPRLILARISGYGNVDDRQDKDYYMRPGHDINYLAETGLLWQFTGETCSRPIPPASMIAEMAGGVYTTAFGIMMALYEREKTGNGKIVDVSIADGVSYVSSQFLASRQVSQRTSTASFSSALWPDLTKQCANLLDGGAPFYRTYETKDKKYVAVGAIEPHFYANLLKELGVPPATAPQMDRVAWPRICALFSGIFITETREYWINQKNLVQSACVSPVWSPEEAIANRPPHTMRPMRFSVSPLSGGSKDKNFSVQVPSKCPVLLDFPPEDR
ncbi:unnamed protein product [Schistocephalus solidus]|uniref:Alpha-methylacyl-CoA racemase n=1 Tax=Schistocephalus solidus TaxID=70667 RepID=A0A183STB3_SCHSO|nr:unnamed protein product [Schistocephalus solidus]